MDSIESKDNNKKTSKNDEKKGRDEYDDISNKDSYKNSKKEQSLKNQSKLNIPYEYKFYIQKGNLKIGKGKCRYK